MQASVAHTPDQNRKKKVAAVLFGAIILTGVLVAFLLITLTNLNKPKITGKKATTIPVSAGPSCPAGGAHCNWTYQNSEDVTFKYTITDQTSGLIEATGETSSTSISFTPKPDHTYTCTVIAVNDCGESSAQTGKNTCVSTLISPTPSPTLPPGVTPSATPTPTKGPSPTPSPTLPPGVTPSATPTPTKGPSPTPSPTLPPGVTPSPTLPPGVTPSATPTPTNRPGTTPGVTEIVIFVSTTPQPTGSTSTTVIVQQPTTTPAPPTAGFLLPSIALIGASIFIIILGLVL